MLDPDTILVILSAVIAVVVILPLVWFIQRKSGKTTNLAATRLADQRRKHPALARLPEAAQLKIINRATWLPLIFALLALISVLAFGTANDAVRDFANQGGSRAAFVIGFVVIGVVLLPTLWLQRALIRRALRKRGL